MFSRFTPAARDVAVDLGTGNTLVFEVGSGIVTDEPSVIAVDGATGDLLAVGHEAKKMLGRNSGRVQVIRPLQGGVVSDADAAERMLRYFIATSRPSRLIRPRMAVCVPAEVTSVERGALVEAALRAGARKVFIIDEAVAAAVGAGLNVHGTTGCMLVDVGAGTTDAVVMSLGGIVRSGSARVGGDAIDDAIATHVKNEYALLLGERTAENIKISVGSAFPMTKESTMQVRGRDLIAGLPKTVTVTSQEVRRAIEPVVLQICETVRETLDSCPPELAGDILDSGIVLAGGSAQLRGLDVRMRHELGVDVRVADSPQQAVVIGAGACLENFNDMRGLLRDAGR